MRENLNRRGLRPPTKKEPTMKQYFILLFILSLAIVPFGVTQQSASEQSTEDSIKKLGNASYETDVHVSVTCSDEQTKRSINSYVKRELRSLGGVKIVEKDEEWQIHIITIKRESKSGRHLGYAMGYTFTERTSRYIAEIAIRTLIKHTDAFHKDNIDDLDMWLQLPIRKYITSALQVGGTDSLRELCEDLVVDFDTEILEPEKQDFLDRMKRMIKNLKELETSDSKQ